ncbi:hypothetical protein Pcac1_g14030 [Phytophthora cactorum]|nr:hypothetical protein Pcac1_g14030 [Phytophthora cactorum]
MMLNITLQGATNVILGAMLLEKCRLASGENMILYCRPQVVELWDCLKNKVLKNCIRAYIVGPPGSGKSTSTVSFAASLHRKEWTIVYVHVSKDYPSSCLVAGPGYSLHCHVRKMREFKLSRIANEKLFVPGIHEENFVATEGDG